MKATVFSGLNLSGQAGHKASFSVWQEPDACPMVCLHLLDIHPTYAQCNVHCFWIPWGYAQVKPSCYRDINPVKEGRQQWPVSARIIIGFLPSFPQSTPLGSLEPLGWISWFSCAFLATQCHDRRQSGHGEVKPQEKHPTSATSKPRWLLWDSCWGASKEGLEGGVMWVLDMLDWLVGWLQADHLHLKETAKFRIVCKWK